MAGPAPRPRRSRLPLLLAVLVAVLAILLGGGLALVVDVDAADEPVAASAPPSTSDLSAVQEYEGLLRDHVSEAVDYPQSPPVGGPHAAVWADCGVYDEPLPDEAAVHDLEHGAFWFSYDADALDAAAVADLSAVLPDNGIMAPYVGLEAPVVVTVWGRQLALSGADDPRLSLFLEAYAGGTTSPEPFASCAGGAGSRDLGRLTDDLAGTGSA